MPPADERFHFTGSPLGSFRPFDLRLVLQDKLPFEQRLFDLALAELEHPPPTLAQCCSEYVGLGVGVHPLDDRVGLQRLRRPRSIAVAQVLGCPADDQAKTGLAVGTNEGIDDLIADVVLAEYHEAPRTPTHQATESVHTGKTTDRQTELPGQLNQIPGLAKGLAHDH